MADSKHGIALRLIKISNVVLMAVLFAICWYGYYAAHTIQPFYNRGNWAMIALFLALYVIYGKVYDAFQISMNRMFEIIYSQGLTAAISDCIMYIIIYLLTRHIPNPLPLLGTFAAQLVLAAVWSVLAYKWYFAMFPPKRSTVVYDKRPGLELLVREYGLEKNFHIQATVSVEECLSNLQMLDDMETVFLSGIHSHDRNIILKYCVEKEIGTYVIPRIGDTIMSGARQMHMFHLPILSVDWYKPSIEYLFLKRLMDIVFSSIAIVLTAPVMFATAVAIKLTDGGPIFYKQCRLTKNGKKFFILKFRSMRVDAEKDGIARLSTGEKDDRITSVGRIIRKIRIDELPQLFNILSGSMTIVGPRPERPEIVKQYMEGLPEFGLRLKAKAGLTGYSQVYGKYNTQPYDKLQMDLMYLAHPGIIEDLRIIFSTIKILFLPESTEGIAAGQTTAALEMDEANRRDGLDEKSGIRLSKNEISLR